MTDKEKLNEHITALQDGDQQALSIIYDAYSPALYGLARNILGSETAAQDVLQESFIKIWKQIKQFDPSKGTFFTWIINICRNLSIDELRKHHRTQRSTTDPEYENPSITYQNTNTIGLRNIMQRLPEEQQLVLDFLYFRGYTQQEVSDATGWPIGTVKTRSRAALLSLRKFFIVIVLWLILKHI